MPRQTRHSLDQHEAGVQGEADRERHPERRWGVGVATRPVVVIVVAGVARLGVAHGDALSAP